MKRFLITIVIVGLSGAIVYGTSHPGLFSRWQLQAQQFLASQQLFGQAEMLLPRPLRQLEKINGGTLTIAGVIENTNQQRVAAGFDPLVENQDLDRVAARKLADMFEQQYFEHVNPQGIGPSDLAKAEGYQYIVVGENLALGNFKDDKALVEAWMNSPGHRANILHKGFQEIGVAVGQGMFEGHRTWLAVQSFGTPLAVCPSPSAATAREIEQAKRAIEQLKAELQAEQENLEPDRYASRQDYEQAVRNYNDRVSQLNNQIDRTRSLVERYNQQIRSFNQCIEANG
jgi:uncharacterized protein YkwD